MGSSRFPWLFWLCGVFLFLFLKSHCASSELMVNFLKTPVAVSPLNSATFEFEVLVGENGKACGNRNVTCKLDNSISSDCHTGIVYYSNLADGSHRFEVCSNGCQGFICAHYSWTIDTVPPTANLRASTTLTNALNVSVNISFSEPCTGGGGFVCSTINSCKLLVYGAGQVLPSTLAVIRPSFEYSLLVGLSSNVQYGRVILVMDKNFCTDTAGNRFTRTAKSIFFVHFDRRPVFVSLRTRIPEKQLPVGSVIRTVLATNNHKNLKIYLYFSEPVLNSSAEVLNSLNTSEGWLLPSSGSSLGNRRFGFLIDNISSIAVVTISLDCNAIISRQGTPISPVGPVTFLYDSQRPSVRLTTTAKMRTREKSIVISIEFMKAVFGFNSSHLSISGGHLLNFHEVSKSIYSANIKADDEIISVIVPENITWDVAGNKNLPSNVLQVRHYSVPIISSVLSTFATASFGLTSLASLLLTVSTASLQSAGAFSRQPSFLISDPARNLFRTACHIQVFALSGWLSVALPIEYYEFTRGLEWAIPYFSVPWETMHPRPMIMAPGPPVTSRFHASPIHDPGLQDSIQLEDESSNMAASVSGLPLTPTEYRSLFEGRNVKPEAEYISNSQNSTRWRDFSRIMFWLAVIDGSLFLLHSLLLLIFKFRNENNGKNGYGALTFPRSEIFLAIYSLPSICVASTSLIKGGSLSGVIVGVLLLGVVSFFLLALFLFLSAGITFGKLLLYKEIHREGQTFHWYQEIVRITLGPGKRGQWTWKSEPYSIYLTIFGPLFEDLRGPPKYMLSQIAGSNSNKRGDRIIASDDEIEDAEAPFIQKLFGILRIYYTLIESVKRVSLGIIAGAHSKSSYSKSPLIAVLSITSFQLFFLVLKKPFIKKRVQLVEIISVACEVGIFASCFVILKKEFSFGEDTQIGIFMILLFLVGFLAQMINEWIALCRYIKMLSPSENSFLSGLKTASLGFVLVFIPQKFFGNLDSRFPVDGSGDGDTGFSADRRRSSGSRNSGNTEKPWMKQLRELAKASFSKEGSSAPNDPSSSNTRWSGFWGGKRSGSSSVTSSGDFKSKPKSLYRDLEAIFASK